MAGNAFTSETQLWVVDSTGTLNTGGVTVVKVIYLPAVQGDDLVLTDNADNNAIILRAKAGSIDMVETDFGERGRTLPSLKVGTIDGGIAYIYFRMLPIS